MKTGTKWRVYLSAFIIILSIALFRAYGTIVHNLIEPQLAAKTVEPSSLPWLALQLVKALPAYGTWLIFGILGVIWVPWIIRKTELPASVPALAALSLLVLLPTGCMGPPRTDVFEEVGPNDTAFVTPLTGDNLTGGQKFNSVQYLDSKKVSAKRIPIPLVQKTTGRCWWEYEWIPAVKVWKVKRTLVSKEWTSSSGTGTKKSNEGIPVVTADAIKLSLGVAVTTFIEEQDAATYLYYHGEAPLETVTDNNVRNYCVTELTREYGQMTLAQAKTNGAAIFAKLYSDATNAFKPKGITIMQLGNAEGFEFQDPKVQEAINNRFIAEQGIATATQAKLAQDQKNLQTIAMAQAQADAAEKLMKAKEATTLQNQLEIQLMEAKARLAMAEKWNGQLPASILPSNSPLLLNLGAQSAPPK
jgi:hypothetical protein